MNEANVDSPPTTCSTLIDSGEESGYELWNVSDRPENTVLVPWLNLLWLARSLASSEDQLRWVARPLVPQPVYDKICEEVSLADLREKLLEIYPRSFLLRLSPEQIVYRNVSLPHTTLEHFVDLFPRILSFGSLDLIGEEKSLAESVHRAWLKTLTPTQRTTNPQAAYGYEELRRWWGETSLWWYPLSNVKVEGGEE